jgi:hypothetical protein
MPLWMAILLFLLFAAGAACSFRAYARGGGKFFLALGITLALLILASLLYVAAVQLFVSGVK